MNRKLMLGLAGAVLLALGAVAPAAEMWETDYAKAATVARMQGKYMLLDFSGSDWCGWCVKLEEEVFSKTPFQKYAKENLVCVLVDFPQQKQLSPELKKQNAELQKKFKVRGFPTIVILSPEGDPVGQLGYQEGGPTKYVKTIKDLIEDYEKARPRKAGDKPGITVQPKADEVKK